MLNDYHFNFSFSTDKFTVNGNLPQTLEIYSIILTSMRMA